MLTVIVLPSGEILGGPVARSGVADWLSPGL